MDFALALLSGILLALSFPKFGHSAFGWIALAPLLVALSYRPPTLRRSFALGLLAGFVYFAGTLYWFVVTMTTFGGLGTAMAVFAAAMGIAYLALYPAAFAVVQGRLVRALGRRALWLSPAVWVASEMLRTSGPSSPVSFSRWNLPCASMRQVISSSRPSSSMQAVTKASDASGKICMPVAWAAKVPLSASFARSRVQEMR